ncbi:acetyltransferase [Pseudomonas phage 201phi2-1]|uniref:N-acetyltransferase domain-containing protein n=1 Tax=Pseudomonas phage 201phi2-1 TaxID=198110 RepID=B3FK17_BP201|nr:acetyltransferase [Pseudomonas phage 201phi2-1]ABY62875.1 hypothetical protein 201phi2-1p042 [Pseudomonas phage 201phi2-1]
MKHDVQEVTTQTVLDYITLNREESDAPWVQSVMDSKTVKMLLCNGEYARQRKAYGMFLGGTMIGYAVVHRPSETLDLLHIAEDFREMGYAKAFLRELDITAVAVDPRNTRAINLYTDLGYELDFIEE